MSAFAASAGWQPAKLMGGTQPLPGCAGGKCNLSGPPGAVKHH
jgi:hypothetical protein